MNKGITLVALIITIIILLILAGVVLNLAINNEGIFTKTQETVGLHEQAGVNEQNELKIAEAEIDEWLNGGEKTPPIPEGFAVSTKEGENTVEEGLVITDGTNDFVWVPVPFAVLEIPTGQNEDQIKALIDAEVADGNFPMAIKVIEEENYRGVLYDFGTRTSPKEPPLAIKYTTTGYREPDRVTPYDNTVSNYTNNGVKKNKTNPERNIASGDEFKEQLQEEYNEMVESVKDNGGFYIGRYETGAGYVVQEKIPPQVSTNWYTFYQKQKEMYQSEDKVESHMIWGSQWDQAMIWFYKDTATRIYVTNGAGMGWCIDNYVDGNLEHLTGIPVGGEEVAANRVKNIYDMAGNIRDWTMLVNSTGNRINRGRLLC